MHRSPRLRATALLAVLLAAGLGLATTAPARADKAEKEAVAALAEKYRDWLEAVQFLISDEEKTAFLALNEDYQRDAFIEQFWRVRDPYPRSTRNEFREDYENRMAMIENELGGIHDDRARLLLLNGMPMHRIEVDCRPLLVPIEVWYYPGSETVPFQFLLLFYQRFGAGPFDLWDLTYGIKELTQDGSEISPSEIQDRCRREEGEAVAAAIGFQYSQGTELGALSVMARIQKPPRTPSSEWVAGFVTYSTDLPADAPSFPAELHLDYPGRHQSRTVVQGTLLVPVEALRLSDVGGYASYELLLNGEVLADGALFDSFRYRYSFPQGEVVGEQLPLVFQRYLRPGGFELRLRAEDTTGGSYHQTIETFEVPKVVHAAPPSDLDPETVRILEEANRAIRSGEVTVQIAPLRGEWQTGLLRIDALTTGPGIDHVTFFLDGDPILTKRQPPFNVELDLGDVPRARVLRLVAYDAAGEELASDEETLNAGRNRFAVRIEEPRQGKRYSDSLRAEVEVTVPEGDIVERVELFLNETPVATLYQEPWVQPVVLPPDTRDFAYLRAVAYRPDGSSNEDTVFINAPAHLEEIDVDLVELYATVLDREKRPVEGLGEEAFAVTEDGVAQAITRFEHVRDLPIHVAVMLDVSASMEEELTAARDAALGFFEQAVTPKDRASIVTFNDHPDLATAFTNDTTELAAGLAGLKAERGTALYDALIYSLYYFNGVRGQRAILLLSDGKDESSRFDFDDALEYAQRSGVAIYAIGLKLGRGEEAKRQLARLADETGGRSFFVEDTGQLQAIYDTIQQELRSRYLIAYQSTNTTGSKGFRTVDLRVLGDEKVEVKTMRGYFP